MQKKGKDNGPVLEVARKVQADLSKLYTEHLDDREEHSAGYKFNEWEIQGIPLRIEIGPRDMATNECVMARRDGVKTKVKLDDLVALVPPALKELQNALYEKAKKSLVENTHLEDDYGKFKERLETEAGFYQMHWCGKDACELRVKEDTKATIRCIPFDQIREDGKCIACGAASTGRVVFARSY